MRDTDRQRFEARAMELGATILVSEPTFLKVLSANGAMVTEYTFTKDGTYVDYFTHMNRMA